MSSARYPAVSAAVLDTLRLQYPVAMEPSDFQAHVSAHQVMPARPPQLVRNVGALNEEDILAQMLFLHHTAMLGQQLQVNHE